MMGAVEGNVPRDMFVYLGFSQLLFGCFEFAFVA